jgi:hypothetical protein
MGLVGYGELQINFWLIFFYFFLNALANFVSKFELNLKVFFIVCLSARREA